MMQRIWAAIAATWAVIAIFGVLAFAQPPRSTTGTSTAVVTRAANGQLLPIPSGGSVHAVTSSSGVAVSGGAPAVTYVKNAAGQFVPVASNPTPAYAVTRSS
jgi:hypothetical protein